MRSVGIKALKKRLSEYIALVAGGETVLITDRNRVVAELVPPSDTRAGTLPDAVLADAVRRGHVTPAALPPGPPPATDAVTTLDELLAELDEDRSER